jgi:hypothetical protein
MRERFTPTAEDLRLLTEHLAYEVSMTFDLALMLATFHHRDQRMQNALVEAHPVHVRQLIDFFWTERTSRTRNKSDAFAADYFGPGEWATLRPERPTELGDDYWAKVGWGVVHLTYSRAHVTPEQKKWEPITTCRALAPTVLCFVDRVDPAKLDATHFGSIRPCVDRFNSFAGT